jgi:homoserine kinase type II
VQPDLLDALLNRAFGERAPRRVRSLRQGYANHNLCVEFEHERVLLRLSRQAEEALSFERAALARVLAAGIPAAQPRPLHDGAPFAPLADGFVCCYAFVDGHAPRPGAAAARQIGAALGALHSLATDGLPDRQNPLRPAALRAWLSTSPAPPWLAPLQGEVEREAARLEAELDHELPRALVHADIFPDNVLFDPQERLAAILDWDEACLDCALFDLGLAAQGFCYQGERFDAGAFEALLSGYAERRALSDAEQAQLRPYVAFGALAMIQWHLAHPEGEGTGRQADRVRALAARLSRLRRDHEDR